MVWSHSAAVGLHCRKTRKTEIMAKMTCRMDMPSRRRERSGFGSRRLLMRIAMEMLGKLKEPVEVNTEYKVVVLGRTDVEGCIC